MTPIRLRFEERVLRESGLYRYEPVEPGVDRYLQPEPTVGDLLTLGTGSVYVVIARQWMYPAYGSQNWPWLGREGSGEVLLTVLVEKHAGLYVNEEEDEEEDEEEGES